MRKLWWVLTAWLLLAACAEVKLVSDYDPVIDRGILEFSEQLRAHLKDMAQLGGTQEGTYQANLKVYNALEAKLEVLIDRASAMSAGEGCKLEAKLFERVRGLLKNQLPPQLQSAEDATSASSNECNAALLKLVKQQLGFIRELHAGGDTCGTANLSCLRPAAAQDALAIADQSITAVMVVEAAKKKLLEEQP